MAPAPHRGVPLGQGGIPLKTGLHGVSPASQRRVAAVRSPWDEAGRGMDIAVANDRDALGHDVPVIPRDPCFGLLRPQFPRTISSTRRAKGASAVGTVSHPHPQDHRGPRQRPPRPRHQLQALELYRLGVSGSAAEGPVGSLSNSAPTLVAKVATRFGTSLALQQWTAAGAEVGGGTCG